MKKLQGLGVFWQVQECLASVRGHRVRGLTVQVLGVRAVVSRALEGLSLSSVPSGEETISLALGLHFTTTCDLGVVVMRYFHRTNLAGPSR